MTTRRSTRIQAQPQPANLTAEQMRAAITKIERRIRDLEEFDPRTIQSRNDPRVESLEAKLESTIEEVFGHGTTEFARFRPSQFDTAGFNVLHETPIGRVIDSIQSSKDRELGKLRAIIDLFKEKINDGGESTEARARRSFGDLNLHPDIARECTALFENGHYAEAVENACKVLDFLVKMRSMRSDPSGTELMQLVFSPKAPILRFNEQTNDSERSEQQGMMYLFAGAMLAIRNPRAHGIVQDHPQAAVEYISLISMLAKSLDRTRR